MINIISLSDTLGEIFNGTKVFIDSIKEVFDFILSIPTKIFELLSFLPTEITLIAFPVISTIIIIFIIRFLK